MPGTSRLDINSPQFLSPSLVWAPSEVRKEEGVVLEGAPHLRPVPAAPWNCEAPGLNAREL